MGHYQTTQVKYGDQPVYIYRPSLYWPSFHSLLHTAHLQHLTQPGLQQRSSTHVIPDATRNQALRPQPLALWLQPSAPQQFKERLLPSKRRPWAQPQAHTPVSFSLLVVQCCTHRPLAHRPLLRLLTARRCVLPLCCGLHSKLVLASPHPLPNQSCPEPMPCQKLPHNSVLACRPAVLLLSLWHWLPFQEDRQGHLSEFGCSVTGAGCCSLLASYLLHSEMLCPASAMHAM